MLDQDLARFSTNEDDDLGNATLISPDEFAVVFGIIDANGEGKILKEIFLNAVYIHDKRDILHRRCSTDSYSRQELKHFIDSEVSKGNLRSSSIFNDDSDEHKSDVPGTMMSNTFSQEAVIQNISNFLFQSRLHLGSIFRTFDRNNDGFISDIEFLDIMRMINIAFSNGLTDDQASCLIICITIAPHNGQY